jgi:hypothetical protein
MPKVLEPEVPDKDSHKGKGSPKDDKTPSSKVTEDTPETIKPLSTMINEEIPGTCQGDRPKDDSPSPSPHAEDSGGRCQFPSGRGLGMTSGRGDPSVPSSGRQSVNPGPKLY